MCNNNMALIMMFFFLQLLHGLSCATTRPYIVLTNGRFMPSATNRSAWHVSMLDAVRTADSFQRLNILYEYSHIVHGFAASMTREEANKISLFPGVIAVEEDTLDTQLHMTRMPSFLGLATSYGLLPNAGYGDGIIIGFVDTGIWPENAGFHDEGLLPLNSSKWRGICQEGSDFSADDCNNKIIGARFFASGIEALIGRRVDGDGEYRSPRDATGHGSAVASIAAGAEISSVGVLGFAYGDAQGIAPKARIAVYKACWWKICTLTDSLAAIDAAIFDGVDILSVSMGSDSPKPFYNDAFMISTLKAAQNNIFVTFGAGNMGPTPSTVVNSAPWVTTVGSSTIDRTYPAKVRLGNGEQVPANSLYCGKSITDDAFPLQFYSTCTDDNILSKSMKGKILICNASDIDVDAIAFTVAKAQGVGYIQLNVGGDKDLSIPLIWKLPTVLISDVHSIDFLLYINSSENATASLIFEHKTVVGERRAPMISEFSSRGPNTIVPEILKPDLLAPGQAIMASWIGVVPAAVIDKDFISVEYNFISGTSVSCAVVAGIAALMRNIHPDWSPAAIRSAMMTTAASLDHNNRPIYNSNFQQPGTQLDFGAGHIFPQLAADPGLIFDIDGIEYIDFLCTLNYSALQLYKIVGEQVICEEPAFHPESRLNYPSFSTVFNKLRRAAKLWRTVTHVAELTETYTLTVVNSNPDVVISVVPKQLQFTRVGEKKSYSIEMSFFYSDGPNRSDVHVPMEVLAVGYVIWESFYHSVRVPFTVSWLFE